MAKYVEKQLILDFFEGLNEAGIEYALIKNIDGELPEHLVDGKDIDILVKESEKEHFEEYMRTHDFCSKVPPCGRKKGWRFAYQLPEYEFWQKENVESTFYVDCSFKLCCISLTPKTWIPLDKCINEDLWGKRVFDENNHWWILDDETTLIYLIVRAIFDKREFRTGYKNGIEERKALLENDSTKKKLSKVFFKYTDRLVTLLNEGRYEEIINDYFTFTEY